MKKNIKANKINLGKNVKISSRAEIICDKISIGDGSVIAGNTKICCQDCFIGNNNFLDTIWIEGSLAAGKTKIKIGNENTIFQNTRLNCNADIEIGNDVNIGQNVYVWTHASSMDVFRGYPFTKNPVKIGSHVWIAANTTILPGIKIGSHVIIGNSSLVGKDIPDGCFAAGIPINIIKKNAFPKKLTNAEKIAILKDCLKEYKELLKLKPFSAKLEFVDEFSIRLVVNGHENIFNCQTKKIKGKINKYTEDFRNFLRYRGIKFFTGKPFNPILPCWFAKLKNKK